ncbi:MAG: hypothetical protein CUN55_02415 [Phototrophicales bacterium]|nr:MAG: hypothetical protein CUN55_02415 [Phototrophicales bacterium]
MPRCIWWLLALWCMIFLITTFYLAFQEQSLVFVLVFGIWGGALFSLTFLLRASLNVEDGAQTHIMPKHKICE